MCARLNACLIGAAAVLAASVGCGDTTTGPVPDPGPTLDLGQRETLFGLSNFPYGFAPSAVAKTFEISNEFGQIYVVQRDNGVPWAEALSGAPFPAQVQQTWADFKAKRPPGRPFYLALEPLDWERKNISPPVEGSTIPRSIKNGSFDSPDVKKAYLNYARRAVEYFEPDYLNLGVECGELAHRRPSAWDEFSSLIIYVMQGLREDYPDLPMGISFGLQSLMEPAAAERSRSLIAHCDYVGISFYPYMSGFHEKFGAAPLPDPPDEWRVPLDWLRSYTDKPIAICETGYNSRNVALDRYGIRLKGTEDPQAQYIRELASIATRDHYLFVVYYFSVDIDRLLAALPEGGDEATLWRENGLYDQNLDPKPALDAWRAVIAGQIDPAPTAAPDATGSGSGTGGGTVVMSMDFASGADLFDGPAGTMIKRQKSQGPNGSAAMLWKYPLAPDDWAWASCALDAGSLADATSLSVDVKSSKPGPVIIMLKEEGGETFTRTVDAGKRWTTVSAALSSFTVDPQSKRDGVLQADRVREVLVAGDRSGASKGKRKVWFANWEFLADAGAG